MSPITGGPAGEWPTQSRVLDADPDTPTAETPADTDPGDYVEAWFRLTLNHPDTKAAAFVAMHVSRLVQERDELRAQVEAARQDTLNDLISWLREHYPHMPALTDIIAGWAIGDRAARGETRQP